MPARSCTITLSVPALGSTTICSVRSSSSEPDEAPKTRVRAPLEPTSMVSSLSVPPALPMSWPAPPSTRSLPSVAWCRKTSSPSPRSTVSSAFRPRTTSASGPPRSDVGPVGADDAVAAGAAVDRQADQRGEGAEGVDGVGSAPPQEGEAVVRGARVLHAQRRDARQAGDQRRVARRLRPDDVGEVRALRGDLVARAVEEAEIGVHALNVGGGEVADVDEIGPAARPHVERLRGRRISGGRPGVPRDPRASPRPPGG